MAVRCTSATGLSKSRCAASSIIFSAHFHVANDWPLPPRCNHEHQARWGVPALQDLSVGLCACGCALLPDAGEDQHRYVFVVIARAARWVFMAIKQRKALASAPVFLAAVRKAARSKIRPRQDSGKEFTGWLCGSCSRPAPRKRTSLTHCAKPWGLSADGASPRHKKPPELALRRFFEGETG